MAIPTTVQQYLHQHGVDFESVEHRAAPSASRVAQRAHVSGEKVAKGVLLRDDQGYVLAVLPATHELDLDALNHEVLQRNLQLAEEEQLGEVFTDCEVGAVPALGPAYGLQTVVDRHTTAADEVYFEAGDHRTLVKVRTADFRDRLLQGAAAADISHHVH